jgi:glycosyltransferase involved in cell wall biosynthesis
MTKQENMRKSLKQIRLPLSCLGSVYHASSVSEVKLSLESLSNVNFLPDEIVIVIDGRISEELNNYLRKFKKDSKSQTKLITKNKNVGTGLAIKEGLVYCTNEIIIRFDSDDISLPFRLKETCDFMIKNPEVDIINTPIIEFIPSKDSKLVISYLKKIPDSNLIKNIINFRNPINHPSVAFKKSSILKIGSYTDMKFFEDYFLWIKAVKKNLNFNNLSSPMVLMKRENLSKRRCGLKYALYDLKFVLKVFNYGYSSLTFYFFSMLRIIVKLIPLLHKFVSRIASWRSKKFMINNPYLFKTSKFSKKYIKKTVQKI